MQIDPAHSDRDAFSSLSALIGHIVDQHHAYSREQLECIAALLHRLDGEGVPCAEPLRVCAVAIKDDLLPHLFKEEKILFPYIIALEQDPGSPPQSCFGALSNPLRVMAAEHHGLQSLLARQRAITQDYQAPAGSLPSVIALYEALAALDADLVEHMYWEDEVLFPAALRLENASRNPGQDRGAC